MLLLKEYGTVYLLMLGLALISLGRFHKNFFVFLVDFSSSSNPHSPSVSVPGFEVERTARVDFQQRRQAAEKKDQMEDFKTNNGIPLRNLLPGHVAEHFMGCGKIVRRHDRHTGIPARGRSD